MANSPQARKRARQSEVRRQHNAGQRSMVRTYVKRVQKAINQGDKAKAEEEFKAAVPIIDRMGRKGIFHPNKAARQKSRLVKHIKAMS